jgi:hypothetical protein
MSRQRTLRSAASTSLRPSRRCANGWLRAYTAMVATSRLHRSLWSGYGSKSKSRHRQTASSRTTRCMCRVGDMTGLRGGSGVTSRSPTPSPLGTARTGARSINPSCSTSIERLVSPRVARWILTEPVTSRSKRSQSSWRGACGVAVSLVATPTPSTTRARGCSRRCMPAGADVELTSGRSRAGDSTDRAASAERDARGAEDRRSGLTLLIAPLREGSGPATSAS